MGRDDLNNGGLSDPQLLRVTEAPLSKTYVPVSAMRPAEELLDDLQVRLLELEQQNEKLRQTQIDLTRSRDHYLELYEFAPLGYLSLTRDARITEINLTGAVLLGIERKKALQECFTTFVAPEDLDLWAARYAGIKKQGGPGNLALSLRRGDGAVFRAQLNFAGQHAGEEGIIRATLADISQDVPIKKGLDAVCKCWDKSSRCLVDVQKETERRLAGELHDRTSGNLAALRINLDILNAKFSQVDFPEIADCLADTRALIEDTDAGIREISTDLRCPLLDHSGLSVAMEVYVRRFSKRTGIPVQVNFKSDKTRLKPALEFLLFRIFQESLTNSLKHARPALVKVTMDLDPRAVCLTVVDDGVGFDLEQVEAGTGLDNMREMAILAGGQLFIHSQPGKGTQIEMRIAE